MAKRAVCVGINDYPGGYNDLNGCVNDAEDWAKVLQEVYSFDEISTIVDAEATRAAMLGALGALVDGASKGDVIVFTYSGHGSWEYDNADSDESDNRDETLCAHDGNIVDDEIRRVLRRLSADVSLTVISDSCHSGSVTRTRLERERDAGTGAAPETAPKPRYMPPGGDNDALRTFMIPIRKRALYPESGMNEILLTGCNALEYSYDAYINGRFNGAMTANATNIIRNDPQQTYRTLHETLRTILPSTQYPQSPQLEGSDANRDRPLFS